MKKSKKKCKHIEEKPIILTFAKFNKDLKFAIWDQIAFFSKDIGMDNLEEIRDIIRETVEDCFLEYSLVGELFEEDYEND